ncbi:MAG: hypothetical protein AB7U73_01775 [Pirellulales bacterium]
MALQVVFHRLAAHEVWAAEVWYAKRSVEVAERFRHAVGVAIGRIVDNVGTHSIGGTRFRYANVPRFPYRLIFLVESNEVAKVVAAAHYRRRPYYWRRRD